MKRQVTRMTIAATAVLVTTVSVAAMAWPGGDRGQRSHDPQKMVERLDRHLDLTEEQATQIEGVLVASQGDSSADKQRLEVLREQLEGQAASFDAGIAQQAADEIGQITGRMVFLRASTQAEVYAALNAEQREEYARMREKREEHREKSRSHGRGRLH